MSGKETEGLIPQAEPWPVAEAVPEDVRRLVIAARNVAFDTPTQAELRALDIASEAFASRVPWDDEPEAPAEAGERLTKIVNSMNLVLSGGWDEDQDCDWGAKPDEAKLDRLDDLLGDFVEALHAQPPAREDAQPVASAYRVRPEMNDPEEWTLMHPERAFDYLDRPGWETQPLYTHPAPDALRVAVSDIAAERQRQVDAEGWSADRDDGYADAELAKSAAAYTLSACGFSPDAAREMWPRSWSAHWWKPTTARRDLVKAGALIVAEIERLDRQALAALQAEQKGGA